MIIVKPFKPIRIEHAMDFKSLTEKIESLQQQILGYRERRVRLTESDTIRVLIMPLLGALGWDLNDLDEVKSEYRHKTSDNPVDCALFLQRAPVLFVEAKALNERMDERKWLLQTLNYANGAGVDWCVLTNGDEYRIYKVHAPVEAEEKLFLTVRINDSEPADVCARKLGLISRDRMGQRAIDALWTDWRIDRQVQAILEKLPEDDGFVRLLAKKARSLTQGEIRGSLNRATFHIDFPGVGDLLVDQVSARPRRTERYDERLLEQPNGYDALQEAQPGFSEEQTPFVAQDGSTRRRPSLLSTREMFDLGMLTPGMILSLKGRPGSEATVIDGRHVEYKGEKVTYNVWGCRVTGWVAIQIYTQAITQDGELLDDLRRSAGSGLQ